MRFVVFLLVLCSLITQFPNNSVIISIENQTANIKEMVVPQGIMRSSGVSLANARLYVEVFGRNNSINLNLTVIGNIGGNNSKPTVCFNVSGPVYQMKAFDSQNHSLLLTATHFSGNNVTQICCKLNRVLNLGESYAIHFYWFFLAEEKNTNNFTFNIKAIWTGLVGIQVVTIILNPGISYLGSSYTPHSISAQGGFLRLSWLEVNINSFYTVITYYGEMSAPRLITGINKFDFGTILQGSFQSKTIEIRNVGETVATGRITAPDWLVIDTEQFSLEPDNSIFLLIVLNTTQEAIYEGAIRIYSNSNQLIKRISITATVTMALPSTIVFFLSIAISTVFTVIILVISYFLLQKYQKKVKKPILEHEIKRNEQIDQKEKPYQAVFSEVDTLTDTELKSNLNPANTLQLDSLVDILPVKEYKILEVLSLNIEGINQQELCSQTGISKSTMSRILNKLELKNFIVRKRQGMSKLIFLNDDKITS